MTTADVSASLAESGRLVLPSYERPAAGLHPPLDFEGYRSTALRHPKQPLVLLPHRLTEVTGPLLGDSLITATDSDLTTQHDGEPQGQRIIVTGQVLDSGGRPVPDTLIEICGHTAEQAEQCAMLIHTQGKYAVKSGSYDELKVMCDAITERDEERAAHRPAQRAGRAVCATRTSINGRA